MQQLSFTFWVRWLQVVAIGVGLFGLGFILLPELMQAAFNLALFNAADADGRFNADSTEYLKFVYGVLGAVMIGWAAIIYMTIIGPFRRREAEAWRTLTLSISIWYAIDTTFSLISGYWQNAVLNTVFLILFALPLMATYKHLHST